MIAGRTDLTLGAGSRFPVHGSLFTHDAIAVAISHVPIGRMPAMDRCDSVGLGLGASYLPIVIIVVQVKGIAAGSQFRRWRRCSSWDRRVGLGRFQRRCRERCWRRLRSGSRTRHGYQNP